VFHCCIRGRTPEKAIPGVACSFHGKQGGREAPAEKHNTAGDQRKVCFACWDQHGMPVAGGPDLNGANMNM